MAWYDRLVSAIGRAVTNLGESILDLGTEVIDEVTGQPVPRRRRGRTRRQQRAAQPQPSAQPRKQQPEKRPAPIRRVPLPSPRLVAVVRGNPFWARLEYERSQFETRSEADDAWDQLIDSGVQPEMMAIALWSNRVLPYSFYVGES